MKYKEAENIGIECGLELPAEFINNIIIHSSNLFAYKDISKEIKELIEDAKLYGIKFSNKCGCAILDIDSQDNFCYICRKFNKLETKGEKI